MQNDWYKRAKEIRVEAQEAPASPEVAPATDTQPAPPPANEEQDEIMTGFRAEIMQNIMPKLVLGLADSVNKGVVQYSSIIMAKMDEMNIPGEQDALNTMLYGVMANVSKTVAMNRSAQILNEMKQNSEAGEIVDTWFSQIENSISTNEEPAKEPAINQVNNGEVPVAEAPQVANGVAPAIPTTQPSSGGMSGSQSEPA